MKSLFGYLAEYKKAAFITLAASLIIYGAIRLYIEAHGIGFALIR